MAFLCPVRIRRGKRKKDGILDRDGVRMRSTTGLPSIGRITGSSSIETLVRVGIEKENGLSPDSKMVVLHDFTPCVDDELEVKRGQLVNVLYQENDWVYVIASDTGHEGFVPHSYCAPCGSQLAELALSVKHKKMPREHLRAGGSPPLMKASSSSLMVSGGGGSGTARRIREVHSDSESYVGPQNKLPIVKAGGGSGIGGGGGGSGRCTRMNSLSSTLSTASSPTVHPFFKDPSGRYVVLYTFVASDENDVSVERGEFVTVLNHEDPDWVWISRSDGQEGFVPNAFVYPAKITPEELIGKPQASPSGCTSGATDYPPPTSGVGASGGGSTSAPIASYHGSSSGAEELRFHGTELVMLYDYKAQAPDDLGVRRGDWVYADLSNQTVDGWLWAFSPKTRKYGFIPKAYARPPAMTSL